MSIWNKVLIGLIFVASLLFVYLSARALKTHQYWREIAKKMEKQIEQEEARRLVLLEGSGPEGEPGIRQLMLELHKVLVDRGRVWKSATPQQVEVVKEQKTFEDQGGTKQTVSVDTVKVLLQVELPDPHQIEKDANLVLFDERDVQEGGRYLGQFTVEAVAGKQVQLKPSTTLSAREIQRLQEASRSKWTVYEIMPTDDREVFVGVENLDALIPEASLAEYLKDGQPTDPNNKESPKYERPLRDYEVLFLVYQQQRSLWVAQMEGAKQDQAYLDASVALAEKEVAACQQDVAKFKTELAQVTRERDAVADHCRTLEGELAKVRETVQRLISQNQQIAATIADIQLKATRLIDARTREMAQLDVAP